MSTANPLHHRAVSSAPQAQRSTSSRCMAGRGWEGWARCLADWLWHATGGGCGWRGLMGFAVPTLAVCFQMWSPRTPVTRVPSPRDAGQKAGPDPSPQLPSRALLAPGPWRGSSCRTTPGGWGGGVLSREPGLGPRTGCLPCPRQAVGGPLRLGQSGPAPASEAPSPAPQLSFHSG